MIEKLRPIVNPAALFLLYLTTSAGSVYSAGQYVYVTNSTTNRVQIVDIGKARVVAELHAGNEPFGLVFSPDGTRVYVANAKSSSVSVIDSAGPRTEQEIPVDAKLPVWLAASPDGTYLYVSNEGSHNVSVLSTAGRAEVARIPVGKGPAGIAVSPDGRFAYVANEGTHDVSVIDLTREEVIRTIPVGMVPQGVAIAPDGRRLYVANFGGDSVSVINAANLGLISNVPLRSAVSPSGSLGPVGIAISPDARHVYTGNFKSGSVSIIDASSLRTLAEVPVGPETFGVAVDPGGEGIFAVSAGAGELVVIDPATFKLRKRIPVGHGTYKVAVSPSSEPGSVTTYSLFVFACMGLTLLVLRAGPLITIPPRKIFAAVGAIFVLALSLRLAGVGWGIPTYDPDTAKASPMLRSSFHLDEDNFLWNLTRVRPESLDFYVADFHWGTLQYYLVELSLLTAETLGAVARPWRDSFLDFDPEDFRRLFVSGRLVSVLLGSCSVFLAYAIGRNLAGAHTGVLSALLLCFLPLHAVNSHYLTPDITMVFLLLLAYYRLLVTLERPALHSYLIAGIAFGLAVSAKYNAVFFLPVIGFSCLAQTDVPWKRKAWIFAGAVPGFTLGEPYVWIHGREFWDTLQRTYATTIGLPEGAVPPFYQLAILQLKNIAFFGLGAPLALGLVTLLAGVAAFRATRLRDRTTSAPVLLGLEGFRSRAAALLWVTLISFFVSLFFVRQPMIRYALPIVVFAVFPIASVLSGLARWKWGRVLAYYLILSSVLYTCLRVEVFTKQHTANQAMEWIRAHIPEGASITKGWPEIPVLNPEKYRVRNYYTADRMVDFADFFTDNAGRTSYPDYILLDNLATIPYPEGFLATIRREYVLVALFRAAPSLFGVEFPEWSPPHDWKYSHPEITIYRRRTKS